MPSVRPSLLTILAVMVVASGVPCARSADSVESLEGSWSGTMNVYGEDVDLVFNVKRDEHGKLVGSLLNAKEGPKSLPVEPSLLKRDVTLLVPLIGARYEGTLSPGSGRIRGEWQQGQLTFPLVLEHSPKAFAFERPQTPKPPFPYEVEEITFGNELANNRLAGTLTRPKRLGRAPAVVLVSDFGPNDRDETLHGHKPFAVLADHLTREGFVVLRYDDRGQGKSTGNYDFAHHLDLATDAWAAVDYLSRHPSVDPTKIGVLGKGEGGLLGAIAATKRKDVAFLITLGTPALSGDKTFLAQVEAGADAVGLPPDVREMMRNFSSAVVKARSGGANPNLEAIGALLTQLQRRAAGLSLEQQGKLLAVSTLMGPLFKEGQSPWLTQFLSYDPAETYAQLTCPVLALYAEHDSQVPPAAHRDAAEAALEKGGNPKVTVKSLSGLNHQFQPSDSGSPDEYGEIDETLDRELLREITLWLKSEIR